MATVSSSGFKCKPRACALPVCAQYIRMMTSLLHCCTGILANNVFGVISSNVVLLLSKQLGRSVPQTCT